MKDKSLVCMYSVLVMLKLLYFFIQNILYCSIFFIIYRKYLYRSLGIYFLLTRHLNKGPGDYFVNIQGEEVYCGLHASLATMKYEVNLYIASGTVCESGVY